MQSKFFFLIGVFILLTSCSKYPQNTSIGGEEFRVGSEGIAVAFLDARNTYFSDEQMQLQLLIKNEGAYDYPQGKISLSGFDRNIMHLTAEELTLPALQGKNAYLAEGDFAVVDVSEDAPLTVNLGESYSTILQANVCYLYKTIATPTVCVVYNPLDQNICQPEQVGLGSQGAPVAVKQVSTETLRDRVRFTIVIENLGDGIVVQPSDESFAACPYGLQKSDSNIVRFSLEINGLDSPSCSPGGHTVHLNNGIGVFTCTFTLRGQETYTTPLKITLDYGYFSSFEQEVVIHNRFGSSSGMYTTTTGGLNSQGSPRGIVSGATSGHGENNATGTSDSEGNSSGCLCSATNMQRWGGCVCLVVDGKNYFCNEGKQVIKLMKKAGDVVHYKVIGNNVVACGNTANPTASCPFSAQMTIPRTLFIYGKTSDGRTVSERCNVQI